MITRADIDRICERFPGAARAAPEEHDSWRVGGKMFACFSGDATRDGVSVKCADVETAQMLIEAGEAVRAPYFHKSWVRLAFPATDLDYARLRLAVSYDIVRTSLPKKLRDAMPAREEG